MAKNENKTRPTRADVAKFIAGIADESRRRDCRTLVRLMRKATGSPPRLWGTSIVGFGNYHYVSKSGREGNWFLTGFSPRKGDLTLYIMDGAARYPALLKKLGRHKLGKGCLYLKGLEDADPKALEALLARSVARMRSRGPCS